MPTNNAVTRPYPVNDEIEEMLRDLAAAAPNPVERARLRRAFQDAEREKAVIRARLAKLLGNGEASPVARRTASEPPRSYVGLIASRFFRDDRSLVRGRKFMHRRRADVRGAACPARDVSAEASAGGLARLIKRWW
jgi:hypothetical protein